MKKLLDHFSEAAAQHNLQLSVQEIGMEQVIGLDPAKGVLLWVFRKDEHSFGSRIVFLKDITASSTKKEFSGITPGGLYGKRLDEYLLRIYLHLERSGQESMEIPFYDSRTGQLHQSAEAERRARYWMSMIAQLLQSTQRRA